MSNTAFYPDIITTLPTADLGFDGVDSYLLQGPEQQLVFMSFDDDVEVPEHSHEAQWGVVLDGEMRLTIDGETRTLTKGDTYFIQSGVRHSASIKAGYKDATLFNQKDRYGVVSAE